MKIIQLYIYIIIIYVAPIYCQSLFPQIINTTGNSSQNKGYSIVYMRTAQQRHRNFCNK